jgi:hypothetical protein
MHALIWHLETCTRLFWVKFSAKFQNLVNSGMALGLKVFLELKKLYG